MTRRKGSGTATAATAGPTKEAHREQRTAELFGQRQELARVAGQQGSAAADRARRAIQRIDEELVNLHAGIIYQQFGRFAPYTQPGCRDDLEAAAYVGLIDAINGYDPKEGRFAGWAYPRVLREVLAEVRQSDHPNLNRTDFEHRPRVLTARRALIAEGHEHPSCEQVSARSGVYIDVVRRVLDAPRIDSMDRPIFDDDSATVGDRVADDAADAAHREVGLGPEAQRHIEEALHALEPREMAVLVRRMGLDGHAPQSLAVIGQTLGVSRESVRKLEASGTDRLKRRMLAA